MRNNWITLVTALTLAAALQGLSAAEAPPSTKTVPDSHVALAAQLPRPAPNEIKSVPPAAPGVFSAKKQGNGYRLVVKGRKYSSRAAIENYLAYRAAEHVIALDLDWFTFVEGRLPGDSVPVPKVDAQLRSFTFRMPYFRPTWRYKTAASAAWQAWSPFSGAAFFAEGVDPSSITEYEITADIVPEKGFMKGVNPLAFHAIALSDFLVNQVTPPQ